MKIIKYSALLLGFLILVMSCEKSKADKEMDLLNTYLLDNSIDVEPTSSGIYYIETLKGSGPEVKGGNEVRVKYTGTFIDGEEFDSGIFPFFVGYGQVIRGWDEGVNYMREGGKATLIIPSSMAYGPLGRNEIPPYTTLIFMVEVLEIL